MPRFLLLPLLATASATLRDFPSAATFSSLSSPIWHASNTSTHFAYLLSPPFTLPADAAAAPLLFTALASPNVAGHGTTQSKLLGAAVVLVNGVPLTAGPGHSAPTAMQAVRALDLLPLGLLRAAPATNVIAVRAYFSNAADGVVDAAAVPRVQLLLQALRADGAAALNVSTSRAWRALDAGAFHGPAGDAVNASHWYHCPNENLDARQRSVGWAAPGYAPPAAWTPAATQPPFSAPLYVDAAPPPAFLSRAACAVTALASGATLLDFGQEMMGGVNLTFADAGFPAGADLKVFLGEELKADGSLLVPARSTVNYTAHWTLAAAGDAANTGLHAHEFSQFRYAQLSAGAPPLAPGGARAWVVQAPFGGDGVNPFELPCARSAPAVPARRDAAQAPGAFASSSPALDAVWNFTAYTVVATSLDVHVDSQTRQRDLCHIDAFITSEEGFAVFPAADASIAARTARMGASNSSAIWASSFEFKASAVLMAALLARETGDAALARDAWAARDDAVNSDAHPADYLALQFLGGLRYAGAPGAGGLLSVPAGCGGAWGCDALIDWPVQTRDGYVANPTDSIRNGLGARAIRALGELAASLGDAAAAARYAAVADGIRDGLLKQLLRMNASAGEAFFVDGADGAAAAHAAVHSTIYAIVGGVADVPVGAGPAQIAAPLAAYMRRRDTGGSSCMTARWLVEALYRLGVSEGAAADDALNLLSRATYPGWGFMMSVGATTTLEAWAPGDKRNTDFVRRMLMTRATLRTP